MRQTFLLLLGSILTFLFVATLILAFVVQTQTLTAAGKNDLSREIDNIIVQINRNEASESPIDIALLSDSFHIGTNGEILLAQNGVVVSSTHSEWLGRSLTSLAEGRNLSSDTPFRFSLNGESMLCLYREAGQLKIIGMLPEKEVYITRGRVSIGIIICTLVLFLVLFFSISKLVGQHVIDNICRVNNSLSRITAGDLNEIVCAEENEEFRTLSSGINQTVASLKVLIAAEAARIDKELSLAAEIQCSALPSVFPPYPQIKTFGLHACMFPAKEVGGDFYDFFMLQDGSLGFVIADVSDKGIPAALFMMTTKTLIKALAETGKDPAQVLSEANNRLCGANNAMMFVTALLGKLNLQTGELLYANAGHNPPVLRQHGKYSYLNPAPGFVLAIEKELRYANHALTLHPTDLLFLYTDGVTEAEKDGSFYGEANLLQVLDQAGQQPPEILLKAIKNDLDAFRKDGVQSDDITMLALQYNGVEP